MKKILFVLSLSIVASLSMYSCNSHDSADANKEKADSVKAKANRDSLLNAAGNMNAPDTKTQKDSTNKKDSSKKAE